MRKERLGLLLGLLALLLLHSPAWGQSFGPAAWIRQAWAGIPFIPMDIAVGPEEEVFVTGHLEWGEDAWFEASADSSEVRTLDTPLDGNGFLVRYDGENGNLGFVRPGSRIPEAEPSWASIYSAGYSVDIIDGNLFHGEGLGRQQNWRTGSAMVTVRDLEGSVLHRIRPREVEIVWFSISIQGTVFDAQGNLYMAGTYRDTLFFSPDVILVPSKEVHHATWDVFMASYAPDGTVRWAKQIEGGTGDLLVSLRIYGKAAFDVDAEGNMVLGAVAYDVPPAAFSAAEDGVVLAYYDRDGALQRIRTLKDLRIAYAPSYGELRNDLGPIVRAFAGDYVPRPTMVRRDNRGNLYALWSKLAVSGRTNALAVGDSIYFGREDRPIRVLTKFDAQGALLWVRNLAYDHTLALKGMKLTGKGHVYIWGHFRGHYLDLGRVELTQGEATGADGFVAHFDEKGDLIRVLHAAGPGYHSIQSLTFGPTGDVYVTGRYSTDLAIVGADTLHARGEKNVFVAKYKSTTLSSEPSTEFPGGLLQASNFPNPFRNTTTLTYRVPAPGHVRLTIYDVLGREVAVLVDEVQSAGAHFTRLDASAWPSGVYLYRLEAGNRVVTGRLVRRK